MYVRKIPEYLDILRKITHFIDNRSDVCVESCTKVDRWAGWGPTFLVQKVERGAVFTNEVGKLRKAN